MDKAGFYISGRAQAWLGSFPLGLNPSEPSTNETALPTKSMQETVYDEKFSTGLRIRATRNGFIGLGFVGVKGFLSVEQVDQNLRPNENWSLSRFNARIPIGDSINAFLACLNGSLQSSSKIRELQYVSNNRLTDVTDDLMPRYPGSTDNHSARRRHAVIGVDDLQAASNAVERLLGHSDQGAMKLVSLYNWAVGSLGELDFARSLITSWAIIERLLEVIWLDFISKNSEGNSEGILKPPTSGRRAKKLRGNNITASIRVEILSVAGHLSEQEYNLIEKSRRVRNEWIHSLAPVTFDDAVNAAGAAAILLKRIYDVKVQNRYEVWGNWIS